MVVYKAFINHPKQNLRVCILVWNAMSNDVVNAGSIERSQLFIIESRRDQEFTSYNTTEEILSRAKERDMQNG